MPEQPQADSRVEGGAERPPLWLLVGLAAAFVIPLCQRGIVLSDEGYLLLQSLDMLDGKVLYRDMDAFVSPGAWFVLAGVFSVIEPSVWASRMPIFIAFLGLVWVSYRIVRDQADNASAVAAVVLVLTFAVWAFPAWTFAFYSPYAVLFGLLGLERLLAWRRDQRIQDLVLCGAALGLSIVFKQNYGVYASVGVLISLFAVRLEAEPELVPTLRDGALDALRVGAGMAAIGLPVLAYFAYHGALWNVFESLVLQPFYFAGRHDIAYLGPGALFDPGLMDGISRLTYAATPLYLTQAPISEAVLGRLHVVLYLVPPVVFAAGALRVALGFARSRRLDAAWFATLTVSGFIFLGVFPRADFNHLVNVYQVVIVAGVVTLYRLAQENRPWLVPTGSVLAAPFVLMAIYWYFALYAEFDTVVEGRRGGVYIQKVEAAQIRQHLTAIHKMTPPGEAVLTVPDLAMLNFLAERPVPSRYYNLYEHHISADGGAEVVRASEAANVRLAITRYDDFFSDRVGMREFAPELSSYLERHFDPIYTLGNDHAIYLMRRPDPRVEATVEILPACEVEAAAERASVIYSHLLFDSLYQYPMPLPVETHCRIRIPEDAELVVNLGYRFPEQAMPNTFFKAEIVVVAPDGPVKLPGRDFPVVAKKGWWKPPREEFRADLSRFAGQDVILIFRTTSGGFARAHVFDPKGFAFVWEHPRLELSVDRGESDTTAASPAAIP